MSNFKFTMIVTGMLVILAIGGIIFESCKDKPIFHEDQYVYHSQMIHDGDTLWDLAIENVIEGDDVNEYIRVVKYVNNMKYDTIISGEYIILLVKNSDLN